MLEVQPFADQQIIECLKSDYGINAAALQQLTLGADIDALILELMQMISPLFS